MFGKSILGIRQDGLSGVQESSASVPELTAILSARAHAVRTQTGNFASGAFEKAVAALQVALDEAAERLRGAKPPSVSQANWNSLRETFHAAEYTQRAQFETPSPAETAATIAVSTSSRIPTPTERDGVSSTSSPGRRPVTPAAPAASGKVISDLPAVVSGQKSNKKLLAAVAVVAGAGILWYAWGK